MINDYRDENYANIDDIEYIFGDIDKYYAPILTSPLFDNGYQRYYFRGDKIIPYLRVLIDASDWLKNKKTTINPQNVNDVYCFMYAVTITLFNKVFGKNPGRISQNLRLHTDIFSWLHINFPASYKDYATSERLNSDVALNILYVPFGKEDICPEYISNHNFDKKDQVILLKISDGKGKWHF